MEQVTPLESGSRGTISVRLTIARAMSFKPLGLVATAPDVNFAVHLQARDGKPVHAIAEASITLGANLTFPKSLWPAIEELCRRLSGRNLYTERIEELLGDVALETAQSLERQGHEELAQSLQAARTRKSPNTVVRALGQLLGSRAYRRRIRREAALRDVLGVFASTLQKLAGATAAGEADLADDPRVEQHYAKRLNQIDRSCCFPEPPLPQFKEKPANLYTDASFLRRHPRDATKGHLLEREALAHGLSILRFPNGSFIASDRNGRRLNFKWSRSPVSTGVSLGLCNHKEATRARLRRCGLPVPRGHLFTKLNFEQVAGYAARVGYPVVCKPATGRRGMGVTASIQDEDQLRKALALFKSSPYGGDDFIIEQHVEGQDYRIVVVGGKAVTAVYRELASVLGTGLHTIADLILAKNRLRTLNPHMRKVPIQFDEAAKYQLEHAGLRLDSVPEKDRRVQLANSNNISRGGDSIEVLDEMHPSITETAIRAVKAIPGLGFCGLDILLEDHTKSIDEQAAAIIELNAHGAIGTGQYPMWGPPRNVARHFLLYCAEQEGLEVSHSPAARLSVKIKVRGKVTRVGYRKWLRRRAKEFGLTGWVANADRTTVEAALEGDIAPVAALVNAAVRGSWRAVPFWVAVEHVPTEGFSSFEGRR